MQGGRWLMHLLTNTLNPSPNPNPNPDPIPSSSMTSMPSQHAQICSGACMALDLVSWQWVTTHGLHTPWATHPMGYKTIHALGQVHSTMLHALVFALRLSQKTAGGGRYGCCKWCALFPCYVPHGMAGPSSIPSHSTTLGSCVGIF